MTQFETLIDLETLATLVTEGACRVVDCRSDLFDAGKGHRDYLSGHIPGAVFANLDTDLSREITPESGRHPLPHPETFCRWLESAGIGDATQVVAYDYGNGALAARLWWMLHEWLGHSRVAVLDGGIAAWTADGRSLETEVLTHSRAAHSCAPDHSTVATTEELAASVADGHDFDLMDVRDPARYRGEHEPIDTVAGHVPGARNVPLGISLNEDGSTWRSPGELRAVWNEIMANQRDSRPIAMCGSGVTACHLILSAQIAGFPAPRLYVGSWSEWIRDSARPVGGAGEPGNGA
jgi:thiosulfate/3-mercaptopyruvate sulfurtransferase